jgi:chromosome segregation ATPase
MTDPPPTPMELEDLREQLRNCDANLARAENRARLWQIEIDTLRSQRNAIDRRIRSAQSQPLNTFTVTEDPVNV